MQPAIERWNQLIGILELMHDQLKLFNASSNSRELMPPDVVFVPFKGSELYLLFKAFIDSGGAPHENYKGILEKVVPFVINKTHKRLNPQSLIKYSDKVDFEAKDNVKRFLQKMIRNIDSYD